MPNQSPSNQRRGHRKIGLFAILLVGLITLSTIVFFHEEKPEENKDGKKPNPSGKAQHAPHASVAVPVVTAEAHQGDVNTYLEALGIVTPVYTVDVVSRVQGLITRVDYREGQIVHSGESLVQIDPRPYQAALTQAEGQLARDRALLKESQIDLVRYRKAYARNAIPRQQLDDQEQTVLQNAGTVVADQGALANAKVNLDFCFITSPIEGRVGLRLVDPGNMVQANSTTALVVVTQLRPITVIFPVSEDHLPEILEQLHQGKALEVEAFDRTQEKKLATGTLLTLDNVIDTTTGTVKLRAVFPNQDESLFPNQFVNAKLRVSTQREKILVSTPAIQRNAQGAFVYVIKPDQTAEIRKVEPGTGDGTATEVQGLKPGEVVAVDGFDKLQEGVKVSVTAVSSQKDREAAGTVAPPSAIP